MFYVTLLINEIVLPSCRNPLCYFKIFHIPIIFKSLDNSQKQLDNKHYRLLYFPVYNNIK